MATRLNPDVRYPVNLQPVAPRRYFAIADLTNASVTNIRMTWESIKSHMGTSRRVIQSTFITPCACCGGEIMAGESCLWVKGHTLHLTSQQCVDEQAAMLQIVTHRQAREHARSLDAVYRRVRHQAKVQLGTLAMFPALPPGPVVIDCDLWASGD